MHDPIESPPSPDAPPHSGGGHRAPWPRAALAGVFFAWGIVGALWAMWPTDQIRYVFREQGGVENATVILYVLAALALPAAGIRRRMPGVSLLALIILMIAAAARELDLHKIVGDYSVFKIGFYLKSDIPLHQRLWAFTGVDLVLLSGLYVTIRHARSWWWNARSGEPWAGTVGTMMAAGALAKVADRSADVLSSWLGVQFPPSLAALIQAFEESTELLLPALVILAVIQAARRRAPVARLSAA